ncbi:hypothetical protein FJU30_25275 [Affinibrenneria salicis]|uniref:Uncharacterized protein n=1 Tax=Affinibrenneria salicis TaxID=2590031 RepID=A0A5J5FR87_9GAMM|nr:hypothetical protein [Affinibrenneria salicis]KAA8995178.1 hypothetical protein FJU30_25275 [Affinibrenneria salicis]
MTKLSSIIAASANSNLSSVSSFLFQIFSLHSPRVSQPTESKKRYRQQTTHLQKIRFPRLAAAHENVIGDDLSERTCATNFAAAPRRVEMVVNFISYIFVFLKFNLLFFYFNAL